MIMCNDYNQAGLRMIDPLTFAIAQRMMWVKTFLDENYNAPWKCIELTFWRKLIKMFHSCGNVMLLKVS